MSASLREGLRWGYDRVLPGFVHHPLSSGLGRQIVRLEGRKTDFNLIEMRETKAIEQSAWRGLGSLGYEIVRCFKPRVVVELGSQTGFSAFAMGLALRDLKEGGALYAVDTWEGDEHSGRYDERVFEAFLDDRSSLNLVDTVLPMRMTFEDASRKIPPGIDLLHIDGWHTFSAVRRDFRQFRPLLNPGAIVMFHDVRTRFKGMRWFWTLMRMQYESFRVSYSHGLGIIRVP